MKRLCYGTFATVFKLCASSGVTQIMLHQALLSAIKEDVGNGRDTSEASRWFNCKGVVSKEIIDAVREIRPDKFANDFKENVIRLIEPNKIKTAAKAILAIIDEDERIAADTKVDYVNNKTKMDLMSKPISAPAAFLAGVLIYSVLHVPNKEGVNCISEINEVFLIEAEMRYKTVIMLERHSSTENQGTLEEHSFINSGQSVTVVTESRPLHPSDFFRGRDTNLIDIKNKMSGKAKLLLLNGMGGIGKTELCRKLFHEAINGRLSEVKKVGWLTYNESIEQTLFRQFTEIKNPAIKPIEYLHQAEHYINTCGDSLLLFVDNANEMTEREAAWLLKLDCKVLLTSRKRTIERLQSIEIGKLEMEDCRVLYRQHLDTHQFNSASNSNYGIDYTENDAPDDDLDAIITMADRHTLAVELLAKTQRAAMRSYKQFRNILAKKGFSLSEISERILYVHNPENIEDDNVWERAEQIFIEQFAKVLDITEIKGEKLRIMQLFSLLAPEPVSADDIKEWLDISDFEDTGGLVSQGWLSSGLVGQDNIHGLTMHPLVSSVVKHKNLPDENTAKPLMAGLMKSLELPDEEVFISKLPFVKHAVSVIDAINGTDDEYPDLINHASNIMLQITDYEKAEEILQKAKLVLNYEKSLAATVHNNLGRAYELQGKYALALAEYEKARDVFLATVGENHRDAATAYSNIGCIYQTLGRYEEALNLSKKAAEIRAGILGEDHPVTQLSYNNMAVIYSTLGGYEQALKLLFHDLEVSEKRLKAGHPRIAVIYSNIAEVYNAKGDYDIALEWGFKSLELWENTVGKENPDTANCYNGLALIFGNKGQYNTALDYYNKAHRIYIKTFGENHPDTALICGNIGQIYDLQGDYANAFKMTEKSLDLTKQIYGEDHLSTVIAYSNIAGIYSHTGDYQKAIDINEKALRIRENILGRFHPNVAIIYSNLSDVYNRIGNHTKAIKSSEEALKIIERTVGLEHPSAAAAYNNIGNSHMRLGNYKDAGEYYRTALSINIKVLGEEHPDTACDYDSLGGIFSRFADYKNALELYTHSMEIKERTLGTAHPKTAVSYSNIAGVYDSLDEYETAREWYIKALKIRMETFGREHADTAFTLNSLAGIYDSEGNHAKALEGYKEVLAIREKIYSKDHQNIASVYNNIAFVYDKMGELDNALEWHERALRIKEQALGEEHPSTAISYNNIAAIYFDKGDNDTAENYYRKTLAIREKKFGYDHPDTAVIYHALACIYDKRGKIDEALALFIKAYRVIHNKLGNSHRKTIDTFGCIKTIYDKSAQKGASFEEWLNERLRRITD